MTIKYYVPNNECVTHENRTNEKWKQKQKH